MKLIPASSARWMMRTLSSWSVLPQAPNIIAPRHSGLTSTPVPPSMRSIVDSIMGATYRRPIVPCRPMAMTGTDPPPKRSRRRTDQRRAATFALYQADVTGRELEDLFERDASTFTRALAFAAQDYEGELDAAMARHARGWTVD